MHRSVSCPWKTIYTRIQHSTYIFNPYVKASGNAQPDSRGMCAAALCTGDQLLLKCQGRMVFPPPPPPPPPKKKGKKSYFETLNAKYSMYPGLTNYFLKVFTNNSRLHFEPSGQTKKR